MMRQKKFCKYEMLQHINDNKLGSHVVLVQVPVPPLKLNVPPPRTISFKPRPKNEPELKYQPLAYNPGEKPKPSNQYINNYPNVNYRLTTRSSAIDDWFGDFSKS